MDTPPLRCVFLGYLWKVARAIHRSPRARLLAAGVEPQRVRSADAARYFEEEKIRTFDAREGAAAEIEALMNDGIDLLVVGAYGRILRRELIARPRLGTLNVHASLLPAYR